MGGAERERKKKKEEEMEVIPVGGVLLMWLPVWVAGAECLWDL